MNKVNSNGNAKQPEKKNGSLVNKILGVLVVILVGVNVQLYLTKYQSQNDLTVQIKRSEDGKQLSALYNTKFIRDAGVQKVLSGLISEYTTKVTSLELQFAMNSIQNIESIVDPLRQFVKIKNLTLNIGTNPINNQTAGILAESLSHFKNLQHLELGIDQLFTNEGRDKLFEAISKLEKLQVLKISLIHTDLSGNALESLKHFINLKNLKSFGLVLVGSKITTKESLLLGNVLSQLPPLESLQLNLYANKILAEGASNLASGLFQQKRLKKLELELFFNNITSVGTESLTGAISVMKNVTDLKFSLEFNYIEDRGGVLVAGMLEKLILINKLSLNLATKNFGSVGYEAVILSLHKLELLEELDLNIGVNKCGTRGADDFKNLLVRHNKLRILKFNFLENYVGDQGATFIAEGIKAQQNLEELQVILSFNTLTDDGVLEIVKAVDQSKAPKIIDLRLSQNKISDTTAVKIFTIIEKMLPRVRQFEFEMLNSALTNATHEQLNLKYQNKYDNFEYRINTIPPSNWE